MQASELDCDDGTGARALTLHNTCYRTLCGRAVLRDNMDKKYLWVKVGKEKYCLQILSMK
jgi:hypothetical protein